jgi:hypothetical protein
LKGEQKKNHFLMPRLRPQAVENLWNKVLGGKAFGVFSIVWQHAQQRMEAVFQGSSP